MPLTPEAWVLGLPLFLEAFLLSDAHKKHRNLLLEFGCLCLILSCQCGWIYDKRVDIWDLLSSQRRCGDSYCLLGQGIMLACVVELGLNPFFVQPGSETVGSC